MDVDNTSGGSQSPEARKLYKVAKEIGLRRDERIDFAQILLRRDITSWTQLSDIQERRLLDALEGYELISELLSQRP